MLSGFIGGLIATAILFGISVSIVAIGYYIGGFLDKCTGDNEQRRKQAKEQEEFLNLPQQEQNKKLISDIHAWVKGDHLERAAQFMVDNYPCWRLSASQNQLNEWISMSVQVTRD